MVARFFRRDHAGFNVRAALRSEHTLGSLVIIVAYFDIPH